MQLTGEYRIPLPREAVWRALNDPEVLKASIPGCESLEPAGENGYAATVIAKVGPVKAKFQGAVTLSDLDPPNGYTISGEGKGGAAGFAKGGAKVRLEADGAETLLRYEVDANVGGKLAQLGSRLIDGAAKKLSDEFFAKFSAEAARAAGAAVPAPEAAPEPELAPAPEPVEEPDAVAYPHGASEVMGAAPPDPHALPEEPRAAGLPTWAWAAGLVVIVVVLLLIFAI
jgi:hypothetical protein